MKQLFKNRLHTNLLLIFLIFSFNSAVAQKQNLTATKAIYFSGYEKDIKGEVLGYHSPLASVNSSLLVRSIAKENYIEWETGVIPNSHNEKYSSFVWIFGIEAKPESHKYKLYINDKYMLTFENPKDTLNKYYTIAGNDSTSLTFDATMVDKFGDLMGFACLNVPTSLYKKKTPLRIKIEGESLNRNTWYMTFRHSINSNIRAYPQSVVLKGKTENLQPINVEIINFYQEQKSKIKILDKEYDVQLKKGFNKYNFYVPAVTEPKDIEVSYSVNKSILGKSTLRIMPVKELTIYLLHHSHNDIGYTHIQSDVVKMQIKNLKDAIEAIDKSKKFPLNARMKWNSEVVWPVEQYLRNCTPEEIAKLKNAVVEGNIEINALYANMLTGLCSSEELMKALEPARKICALFGVEPKTAMISDVPGLSWGIVPVLANYGIKYLQIGQNGGDRIGNTLTTWGDKPFYWISPSGKDKLLCFTAGKGYSFFHTGLNYGKLGNPFNQERLSLYLQELNQEQYPYDIIPIHYTVGSDNGPVHPELPAIVKEWNEKYVSPKVIISTVNTFFAEFEEKYGSQVPTVRGDYTGTWDDGAASTSFETGLNRRSAQRLNQAEALYTIIKADEFPFEEIAKGWENVLLYSEHTWGSWNSMSDPENPFTKQQWAIKRGFALRADSISKNLVYKAIQQNNSEPVAINVFNTNSWKRSDWVTLECNLELEGKAIVDSNGKDIPFQILKDKRIALYAEDVPPLGSKIYFLANRFTPVKETVVFDNNKISSELLSLEVNPIDGNITSLKMNGVNHQFVDAQNTGGLTDYQYVNGRKPNKIEKAENIKIVKGENGPHIKSFKIFSDAAGCNKLIKEITLYSGLPGIGIKITVDRKKVYTPEGVHIAFPFNIPDGKDYINTAWANYTPEYEQIKGSCKNYFPVQKFIDVSNQRLGISLMPIDAPMIEIGEIMTDANFYGWKTDINNSPNIYSYIMNNYWGTNYKAEQEGITSFSYTIYPHLRTDLSQIEKYSIEQHQPLFAVLAGKESNEYTSLFSLTSDKIVVSSISPDKDKKGLIVRLQNLSMQPSNVSFIWAAFKASKIFISNPNEAAIKAMDNLIEMLPNDIITLKLER